MPRDVVIVCGDYSIECTPSGLPEIYDQLRARAVLTEEIALDQRDLCCFPVRRSGEPWPFLIVALGCSTAAAGLSPGALLVSRLGTLFLGYGERLVAYALLPPAKLWSATAPGNFRFWEQHGEVVLLSAGLALEAWSTAGEKLWTWPAAAPWSHHVRGEIVECTDGAGRAQRFPLRTGARGGLAGS